MPNLKRTSLLIAAFLLVAPTLFVPTLAAHGPATPGSRGSRTSRPTLNKLMNGHRVVNVVDDFLLFWEQAKSRPLGQQRRLWLRMVENKHRDYFDRAVYRSADARERRQMLNQFLRRVPERVDAIREFNRWVEEALREGLLNFEYRFASYSQQRDIYVGLSLFRFDGSVRPVQNEAGVPDTLCLGADVLADYSPEEVQVLLAHEFFHLYHFGFLFRQPSLAQLTTAHMPLMIEGMAVAAAEQLYPQLPAAMYLHFSEEEYVAQKRSLAPSSHRFLDLINKGAPPEQYGTWFTNSKADKVPPRGGYLIGYEVTRRVLAAYTLEQMAQMSPAQLREHAEEQLTAMATDRVLLMALCE
jgi:hypothetical protein